MSDEGNENDGQVLVRRLLLRMIEDGCTVEDVCHDHPGLLIEVRRQWERVRIVEDRIEALFPPAPRESGEASALAEEILPQIPGYEIESLLGRGGMGVVYKARHVSLNRIVAIKFPLAGALATAMERQRHKREAQAVAALKHPDIITVYDVGEVEGRPYFTMEFVDGQHLGAHLANTPQPAREAATLVATLADAVHRAHLAGIIHRDLKPANVLLAPDGRPKITDFGLSRHVGGDATLTLAGFQFGTPSYMAPEQANGQPGAQTSSVDTYALGAILYEMLTGRPPFRGESAVETVRQVLEEEPAPPSRLNPRVPRDLELICSMCLRKEPQRRYPTSDALAQDLRRFLGGEPIQARAVGSLERLYRWGRRHPARAALVGAGVSVLLAGIGVGFWMQHIQNARAGEVALREGRARQAIETAVGLANDLRTNERWIEARHVLDDARAHTAEANSEESARVLDEADQHLTAARELDDIRRRYPESNATGFDYRPAFDAYKRIFARLGLGEDVPLEAAARMVDRSPIRKQLLIALDNSAFVSRVFNHRAGMERPLAIARAADPDPWRDRFRQPTTWFDHDMLAALYAEAGSSAEPPPSHQIVIVGVLLGGLGATDEAVEILRAAHRRDPIDFWVNLELGNALSRAGRPADAAQYFRAAVTIQPKSPGPWVMLGAQLDRISSREEAIVAARFATELNPRSLAAWGNYISYLSRAGQLDVAELALDQGTEANLDQRAMFDDLRIALGWDFASRWAARGEWQRAFHAYESVRAKAPDDAEYWFEFAAVSLIAGRRDDYSRMREWLMQPDGSPALRGFLVARAVTLAAAPIDLVEAAAERGEPEFLAHASAYWARRQRGALLCRTGRCAEAIPIFEQGLAADALPGRTVLNWLWLAIANHQLGKTEDAARWHALAVNWLAGYAESMPVDSNALGLHLHDWLEARVLRQEADSLMSSGGSGEARKPR